MSKIGDKRLSKLADYLDTVKDEDFDYAHWRNAYGIEDALPGCGTSGCAIGHAATIPEFQKLGLHFPRHCAVPSLKQGKREYHGTDAARKLFGLNLDQAEDLFIPRSVEPKKNPQYVARKIRTFLLGRQTA